MKLIQYWVFNSNSKLETFISPARFKFILSEEIKAVIPMDVEVGEF